ncbi:MAG: succinate--CoA ligase subunit beta [Candidatus Atribacteria bacterium]|nr:succinate--CoA ligase subunit beta [Candidatus Atribacteria bacterium]
MRFQEYEAKEIFKEFGIPVPEGIVINSDSEIIPAIEKIGIPAILKAQVLVGGRGKAGGIRVVENLEEAVEACREIFNKKIKGYHVKELLIEKKLEILTELYCGITINRTLGRPVIMVSSEGGINIEETAEKNPNKIFTLYCDPLVDIYPFQIVNLVKNLGLKGDVLLKVSQIIGKLLQIFNKYNGIIVEVNPLVITNNKQVLCLDAVIQIDDSALFRYPEFQEKKFNQMDYSLQRLEKKGATYVQLEGNIGLICSGAGLAMATMDTIKSFPGLSPANFLETGGSITPELMEDCMEIVLERNVLKGIFINIYGGINPIHEGAKGIARVIKDRELEIPIVAKALGNKQEETWEILEKAGVYTYKKSDTHGAINYLAEILHLEVKG